MSPVIATGAALSVASVAGAVACIDRDVVAIVGAVAETALSVGSAAIKTLPFGEAFCMLAEEILVVCEAAKSNDEVIATVHKRTSALQHTVVGIQEAKCNTSPSFQQLVDILVKLREVSPH